MRRSLQERDAGSSVGCRSQAAVNKRKDKDKISG